MPRGICPKCKQLRPRTQHHIYPKRWYGRNNHIVYLCRTCHNKLELLIPFKKMNKHFYKKVVKDFLAEVYDENITRVSRENCKYGFSRTRLENTGNQVK